MADAFNTGEESLGRTERRAHARQIIRSLAYIEIDQDNGGIVLDACEGGLAVQAAMSLMDQPLLKVRLQAPQSKSWIEAGARIVWVANKRKRAGLQFTELSDAARSQISLWLTNERPRTPSHSSIGVSPEPVTRGPKTQSDTAVEQPANRRTVMPPTAPAVDRTPIVEFVLGSAEKSGYLLYADSFEQSSTLPRIAPESTAAAPRAAAPVPSVAPAGSIPPIAPAPPIAPVPRVAPPSAIEPEPAAPIFHRTQPPIFERPAPRLWSREVIPSSYDRKQEVAGHFPRVGLLIGLIAALIVLSLGAGWAAGRGVLDVFVQKIQIMAKRGTMMVSNAAAPAAPAPETSTNSHAAAIPPQPPPDLAASTPPQSVNRDLETPAPKPSPSWMQPSMSGPIRQRAGGNGREGSVEPPTVHSYSGPGNIILFPAHPTEVLTIPQAESRIGTLQRGGLVRRVNPVYPELAKRQGVEGTVKLHIIIGVNGEVRSVDFISGPKMLAGAAENAVRNWLYAPSLLDGKPIEMEYEVSLVFHLARSAN